MSDDWHRETPPKTKQCTTCRTMNILWRSTTGWQNRQTHQQKKRKSFSCLMWWINLSVRQYSTRCFVFFAWQRQASHQRMRQNPWKRTDTSFCRLHFCKQPIRDAGPWKDYDKVQVFLWNVWRSVWSQLQRSWASMIDVQHFRVILNESYCSNKIYLSGYDQRYEGKAKGDKYKTLWYTIEECN